MNIPPDGWGVMDRSFLDLVDSSREMIKTVTQSNPQALKLSIQFDSGWETEWYSGIEEGLCPLHYQDNVGWVWIGVKFQHKSGIHPRLRNLRPDLHGMDKFTEGLRAGKYPVLPPSFVQPRMGRPIYYS